MKLQCLPGLQSPESLKLKDLLPNVHKLNLALGRRPQFFHRAV